MHIACLPLGPSDFASCSQYGSSANPTRRNSWLRNQSCCFTLISGTLLFSRSRGHFQNARIVSACAKVSLNSAKVTQCRHTTGWNAELCFYSQHTERQRERRIEWIYTTVINAQRAECKATKQAGTMKTVETRAKRMIRQFHSRISPWWICVIARSVAVRAARTLCIAVSNSHLLLFIVLVLSRKLTGQHLRVRSTHTHSHSVHACNMQSICLREIIRKQYALLPAHETPWILDGNISYAFLV